MRTGRPTIVLLFALLAAMNGMASAQGLVDRRPRQDYRIEPASISLDQAVQMAQNRYRAKAVKAETVNRGGRRVHEVRLLSAEGKVWTVRIDAETGSMH
jgi:uncharacterized membrane protein YkoI